MLYAVTLVAPPDAVFVPETVVGHALAAAGAKVVGRYVLGERAVDLKVDGAFAQHVASDHLGARGRQGMADHGLGDEDRVRRGDEGHGVEHGGAG